MQINYLLLLIYVISFIVEIGLPVALGIWLIRKYKSSWILIVTGIATYTVAELIHIPALNGIKALFSNGTIPTPPSSLIPLANGLIIGLLAGILENSLRWIGFKVNGKQSKPFRSSIALGIGHGGIELAVTGALLAVNLASVLFYNPGAQLAKGASSTTVQSVLSQISAYWSSPWYYGLLALFEHLVTFTGQFALSIMVWKSVAKAKPLWLLVAVVYQTILAGMVTFLSGMNWGLWQIEGVNALFLLLNVLLVYFFWNDEGGIAAEPEDDEEEDEDEEEGEGDEDEDLDEREEEEKPEIGAGDASTVTGNESEK